MKSKRTIACDISPQVKEKVADRDSIDGHPVCVYCGKPAPTENPLAFSNAHYISRGQGGLGIEQNILTLDWECHLRYDQSEHREEMKAFFREYLSSKYPNWNEEELIYTRAPIARQVERVAMGRGRATERVNFLLLSKNELCEVCEDERRYEKC